ncbi:hypothetical protein E7V67_011635 [[Empedobacter] haloabium]|uniref:Uncharacterized protein n=1 Tax=[Empedobacter] haloabium TaxID=592317 RepID=A0ABZ1UUU9_9BURK
MAYSMESRRDSQRAELINDVLRAEPDVTLRARARFLADVGVPFPVICRVISEPARRRRQPQTQS